VSTEDRVDRLERIVLGHAELLDRHDRTFDRLVTAQEQALNLFTHIEQRLGNIEQILRDRGSNGRAQP
jgi:hypothetical protein